MASEFEAVGRRHAHVQKDSVEFVIGEALGGLRTAGEGSDVELGGAQEFGDQLAGNSVIVYNKDLGTQLSLIPSKHANLEYRAGGGKKF
jgi:hypothetical protein